MRQTQHKTKIVLLPGLDGTGVLFQRFVETCPQELDPQVHTFPGNQVLSYKQLQTRIAPLLPKDEPFLLLGESFSGPLALELAARRPPGLLGVILVVTFIKTPTARWLASLTREPMLKFRRPAFFLKYFIAGRHAGQNTLALLDRARQSVGSAVMASRVHEIAQVDATEALKNCPVPILYLQATQDHLVRPRALRQILAVRPDVEVRQVEAPHLLLQTAPEKAWNLIGDWASPGRTARVGGAGVLTSG